MYLYLSGPLKERLLKLAWFGISLENHAESIVSRGDSTNYGGKCAFFVLVQNVDSLE